LAGGLYKFYATPDENINAAPTTVLLVKFKQQANPILSIHNYTLIVINRNDKNKQHTL
jgi:hypothetical protein